MKAGSGTTETSNTTPTKKKGAKKQTGSTSSVFKKIRTFDDQDSSEESGADDNK